MVKTRKTKVKSRNGINNNKKTKKISNRRMQSDDDPARKWVKLIADPCYGQLTHPLYGGTSGGYLARFKRTFTVHQTAASNNGWFMWFPEYHCDQGISAVITNKAPQSSWLYESNVATGFPTNTITNPFGSGGVGGSPQQDPASPFLRGVNGTARTVAACVKIMYTGPPLTKAGIFTFDNQVKASQVLDFNAAGVPDIAQQAGTHSVSCPTPRTMEIRWIPNLLNSSRFRRATPTVVQTGNTSTYVDDTLVMSGFPSSVASYNGSTASDATGIVVTWRGLPSTISNDVTIECYKVVEWMPYENTSLVQPRPAPPTQQSVNRAFDYISQMAQAISYAGDISESVSNAVYSVQKMVTASKKVRMLM